MSKYKSNYSKSHIPKPDISVKRILATAIDWALGGILCSLPAVLMFSILTKSNRPFKSFYDFEALALGREIAISMLIISIILTFVYYVIVPTKMFPGQTVGKHFMKLKIVGLDNRKLKLRDYFIREFLILNLIEGTAVATSNYFRVLITTLTRIYVDQYFSIFWNISTLISVFLVFWTSRHLSIHDYLCQTTVVAT